MSELVALATPGLVGSEPIPDTALPDLVRESLAGATAPVDLRVICTDWPAHWGFGLTDLIRDKVVGAGHRALVLHKRSTAHGPTLAAIGAEVRLLSGQLPDIAIIGDAAVVVDHRGQRCLAHSASLVDALRQLHIALWDKAVSLERTADQAQNQVLAKLCAGMKDETAARQLNMSVRTYRRHVAGILRDLDVTSRFEAGLKVAELDRPRR